jgi:hypothetical protein
MAAIPLVGYNNIVFLHFKMETGMKFVTPAKPA